MHHRVKSQVQVSSRNFYFGAVVVILLCGALITFQYLKKNQLWSLWFYVFHYAIISWSLLAILIEIMTIIMSIIRKSLWDLAPFLAVPINKWQWMLTMKY